MSTAEASSGCSALSCLSSTISRVSARGGRGGRSVPGRLYSVTERLYRKEADSIPFVRTEASEVEETAICFGEAVLIESSSLKGPSLQGLA